MSIGQTIIDSIIQGKLCTTQCAEHAEHPCIVIWSSGAAEQIDAMVAAEADKPYVAYTEALRLSRRLQDELDEVKKQLAELEKLNRVLSVGRNDEVITAYDEALFQEREKSKLQLEVSRSVRRKLEDRLAEAQKDVARINWLDSEASTDWWANDAAPGEPGTLRKTLDDAMKGEK